MSSEEQLALLKSSFDEVARQDAPGGVEYWYARDLQRLLGYAQWRNFVEVIEKAKISCETAGFKISDHFADVGKMVELGSGACYPKNENSPKPRNFPTGTLRRTKL